MKRKILPTALIVLLLTVLSGCTVIGGIFKAGIWSGIIIVVLIIAVILFIVSKMGKRD